MLVAFLSDLGINAISLLHMEVFMGYEWDYFLPTTARAEVQQEQNLVEF